MLTYKFLYSLFLYDTVYTLVADEAGKGRTTLSVFSYKMKSQCLSSCTEMIKHCTQCCLCFLFSNTLHLSHMMFMVNIATRKNVSNTIVCNFLYRCTHLLLIFKKLGQQHAGYPKMIGWSGYGVSV